MKSLLYSLVLIFLPGFVYGMNIDQENLQTCKIIKTLAANTPSYKYKEVTQLLANNGLSTRICVRDYLLKEKEHKAQKTIEKEFNLPSTIWQEQNKYIEKIRENKRKSKITVTYEKNIPEYIQQYIETEKSKLLSSLHVQLTDEISSSMENVGDTFILKLHIEKLKPFYNQEKHQATVRGKILHELYHMQEYHQDRGKFLSEKLLSAVKNKKIINLESQTFAIFKYLRYREAFADRIPAACGTYQDAKDIYAHAQNLVFLAKALPSEKNTHPTPEKRMLWAMRIKKLKKAEQQLAEEHAKQKKNNKRTFEFFMNC